MNQSRDFSEFMNELQGIIDNGRAEADAPKESLERMRLAAVREGKEEEANRIAEFLRDVAKELLFFRKAARIGTDNPTSSWGSLLSRIARPMTPSTFDKTETALSVHRPFQCYEGIFRANDGKNNELPSSNLKGPFFLAVAANFSEAVNLPKGNLVCLFNQATTNANNKGIELRIWGAHHFSALFSGKSFDQASLSVPPASNETLLELHRGQLPDLFQIAVMNIVRASLGRNPPQDVSDEWMRLLNEYKGDSTGTPQITGPN